MGVLIWLGRDSVVTVCSNEMVVMKDLLHSQKHTCTYFNVVRLSV